MTSFSLSEKTIQNLQKLIGSEIIDIRCPKRDRSKDETGGALQERAYGFATNSGKIYVSGEAVVTNDKNEEIFILVADVDYSIKKYPGGPSVEWQSMFDLLLGFKGGNIKNVLVITSARNSNTSIEDEVLIDFDYCSLHLTPSDMPLWITLSVVDPIHFFIDKRKKRRILRVGNPRAKA